jgi:ribosome-associated translation inhibitor RaiA
MRPYLLSFFRRLSLQIGRSHVPTVAGFMLIWLNPVATRLCDLYEPVRGGPAWRFRRRSEKVITDVKIDFCGAEPTEALQTLIAKQVHALEGFYGRLTSCHVTVKPPGRHKRKGGQYEIHIRLGLPNGRELNVNHTPAADGRLADIVFCVDDAFRRARRQLQDNIAKSRDD